MSIFPNVCGHESISRHLQTSLVQNAVSHAYLFEGIEGVGKHTMAKEFIKALLCTRPQADHKACGQCLSCITIDSGNHPDLTWINRGEKQTLGVDVIREKLLTDVYEIPMRSSHKVYVIEDADTMTPGAQNALLKTLEEPPEYAVLILLAKSVTAFLPTILSRVIRLRFQPIPSEEIEEYLMKSEQLPRYHVSLIASLSQGSIGKAKTLLASGEFTEMREKISQMLQGLYLKRESEVLGYAPLFEQYKERKDQIFDVLSIGLRDMLVLRVCGKDAPIISVDQKEELIQCAEHYTVNEISNMFTAVQQIGDKIRRGAQYSFAVDCLLMQLVNRK